MTLGPPGFAVTPTEPNPLAPASGSPWASTTRCSTCAASQRSGPPERSPQAALQTAAATSGRAVLVSGLTVVVAMAGMFFAGSKTFTSFAVGTIIVVAVAVAGP